MKMKIDLLSLTVSDIWFIDLLYFALLPMAEGLKPLVSFTIFGHL